MQKLKQKIKQMTIFLLFMAIFSAYNQVFSETAEIKDHDAHAEHSQDWPGIYYGSLPCADCVGIKTTLVLNKNNSYVLLTQHLGKSEREFVEKGKFAPGDKSDTLVLTPRTGAAPQQYLVGENMLIQLDSNGNRITGKQADRYILRRTDVTAPAAKHGH